MSAKPHIARVPAEAALVSALAAVEAQGSLPLTRARALATLRRDGLPHRRVEDWRYTDLKAMLKGFAPLAEDSAPAAKGGREDVLSADPLGDLERLRIVLVNGHYREDLSDPVKVTGLSLAYRSAKEEGASALLHDAKRNEDTAVALHHAFAGDHMTLSVEAGVCVEPLIEIAHIVTGDHPHSSAPGLAVNVESGARIRIIETFTSPEGVAHQVFPLRQFDIADEGSVTFYSAQFEGRQAMHLGTIAAAVGTRAKLDIFALTLGAMISRTNLWVDINGAHTHVALRGINLIGGTRHADISLKVHHTQPDCISEELFKTVVADAATGVFQGKISVDPIAQKTDGMMMAQSLLLSQKATFNSKPELEIYADDVRCTHGATCGAIDEDLLFYLMARGIDRHEAEALLVRAFVGEVMERLADEPVKDALWVSIRRWLDAHRSAGKLRL